jgi:hypothetical protein
MVLVAASMPCDGGGGTSKLRMSTAIRRWLELAAAGLLGGAVAGVTVWKPAPAPPPAEARAVEAPPAPVPGEALAARVERLEGHVRRLGRELAQKSEVSGYEGGGDDEGAAREVTLSAADPRFQRAVRAVIEQAALERDEIEKDRRSEQRESLIGRQVERLGEKVALSEAQATEVEQILLGQFDRFRALRDADDRPTSPKEWRERMAAIRDETHKQLAEVLSAEQLAAYDAMLEEEGWNGPWGR